MMPALFLGIGRHSHLRVMNVAETVAAPMAWAGFSKAAGRDLLRAHGIPVAPSSLAHSPAAAADRARELGYPVVVKRLIGGNSDGVILNISDRSQCLPAAERLLRGGHPILVEKMMNGVEVRLHFSDGRLTHAWHCEPRTIRGDGTRTFAGLIAETLPEFWESVQSIGPHRDRLLLQLSTYNVNAWSDLERIRPPEGKLVRVSAATGAKMTPMAKGVLHAEDIAQLERFLAGYGSPSAGIDLMLPTLDARLSSGAVLEINVPCGMNYLGDEARRIADREVVAFGRSHADFVEAGGRVPVWLINTDDVPADSVEFDGLVDTFKSRWPSGRLAGLDPAAGWLPILTDKSAAAFLIKATDSVIEAVGMPANLRPAAICFGDVSGWAERHPKYAATVTNAGGRIVSSLAEN
jgi:hypothetical protein